MSKAKLIIDVNGEDVVAEFDVKTGEDTATITITPSDVKIHTKTEPKVVPVEQFGIPGLGDDEAAKFQAALNPQARLIHPETTVDENVRHVLVGLRDGASMTRANSAFSDLLVQLGVTEPDRDEPED